MPGPLGTDSNSPTPDKGTLQLARNPALGPTGAQPTAAQETVLNLTSEERSLAAVAYAEGSIKNVFEEMAGIAAVVVRQAAARHQTVIQFLQSPVAPRFTHVLANGNPRHEALSRATDAEISSSAGMMTAVKAARHALAGKQDFSAGGYFWDGADIRDRYEKHPKVQLDGIHFTSPKHNIYGIKERDVPGENYYTYPDSRPPKLRGKWKYKYESTTAIGGTVFWRLNADFIKGAGNKEYD